MASANLQFKIGSTFTGEGFKQAQKACGDIKSSLGPAIGAANSMATALNGMDTSATKAFGAVNNLIGAFTQGGVQGAVMAAAMMALNGYIDSLKEKAEKATAAANALAAAAKSAFSAELNTQVKDIIADVTSLRTEFEKSAKQANEFADALLGWQKSEASGSVIALQIEKFQAMVDAETEAGKQDVEATYNLAIAKEKAKTSSEEWQTKLNNEHGKVVQASNRVATIQEQIATIQEERAALEETLADVTGDSAAKRKEANAKMDELSAKEDSLRDELQSAMEDKKIQLIKEKTAIQDAANAQRQMTLAVNEAEAKVRDIEFESAKKLEEEREAYMAELEESLGKGVENLKKQLDKNVADLKAAGASLSVAIQNQQTAENAFNNNFANNAIWQNIQQNVADVNKRLLNGRGELLRAQGEIAKKAGDIAVQKALENGDIKTMAELQRVRNAAEKETRLKIADKVTTQMGADALKYEKLMEKSDKSLTDADKRWMKDYEAVKKANEAQIRAVEEAKRKVEEARKKQDQLATNVQTIAEALGKKDEITTVIQEVKGAVNAVESAVYSIAGGDDDGSVVSGGDTTYNINNYNGDEGATSDYGGQLDTIIDQLGDLNSNLVGCLALN